MSGATSCKKFLEKPQVGTLTEEEALKTEADLQAMLNGSLRNLTTNVYNGKLQFISDLLGDEANGLLFTEDNGEIFNRKTSIFGSYKNDFYRDSYYVINAANKVLDRIDIASTNKDYITGQAKFIRAIVHFEMVRLFAQPWGATSDNSHLGVPLRLTSNTDAIPRSTVKQVYDQIVADLKDAETKLPDAVVAGYPSKWAAKAYLAKVYFQQNNFTEAFNYANQVITSNKFTLDADYTKRFALGIGTSTGSKEAIFWQKNAGDFNPGGELRNRYRSDGTNFQANSDFHVTDIVFTAATAAADVRKAWYEKNSSGYNMFKKYNADFFDMPLVHLTEIVLIRAEAGAETGTTANVATALADINSILSRAYNGSNTLPGTAAAGTIITTARTQREWEMMGEGNRVQEIKRIGVRNNTSVDRRGAAWNCNGLALQFPQGENAANTSFVMNPEGGCN